MSKGLTVAFLFFAGLYLVALNFDVAFLWLLKVIPIVILFVAVLKTPSSTKRTILLIALFLSGCGDLLLAFNLFIYGVAAFLLAQLSYAIMFKSYWQGFQKRWPLSMALMVCMLTMAWLLLPKLGELQIAVMAYLMAIGTMGILATQSSLPVRWAVLGALFFIASDTLIAINKFMMPLPLEGLWVMSTYYSAQFMLVLGFLTAIDGHKE